MLGAASRRYCLEQFGESTVVDRLIGYYHAILGRTPAARSAATPLSARVSVVIPAYNSAAWIGDAIESVLHQTAPAQEIIVIDDGSTDDTADRLAPYSHVVRCVRQDNRGVAAARNQGVSLARGDLIAFLDADDVWHPRKLEVQQRALADDCSLSMVGSGTFDWPGQSPSVPERVSMRMVTWPQLVVRNRFTTSSVLVRRCALPAQSPFDESLRGPEDLDLWLRIAERGRIGWVDAPLVGYRTVQDSLGRQPASMEQGLARIFDKLDARGSWGAWRGWGARSLLRRKAISHARYSCAYMYNAAGRYGEALRRLVSSILLYPWPYQADEVRIPMARPRMLARVLSGWLLGRRPTREGVR